MFKQTYLLQCVVRRRHVANFVTCRWKVLPVGSHTGRCRSEESSELFKKTGYPQHSALLLHHMNSKGGLNPSKAQGVSKNSAKWLSCSRFGDVLVHNTKEVFEPVATAHCNLVSIFGRAREGKSFLMNCIANQEDLFATSNAHSPCTEGADISKTWLKLSALTSSDTADIHIGFVDAEGQGDKDVSYDANLICPILLASKCVIFNWKGDLQKDHILSTLGIMARAAQNIAAESAEAGNTASSVVFQHLHIVFRDWQAVDSSVVGVQDALFSLETESDGSGYEIRNLTRKKILEAFTSIRVWLFEPPTERTADLKQKLTFDKTSATFREQVRALREALALQLKEPTYIAGHALTGRMYGPLAEQIAEALNSGQAVLPMSLYSSILHDELRRAVRDYQRDLAERTAALAECTAMAFAGEDDAAWVDGEDVAATLTVEFSGVAQATATRHLQSMRLSTGTAWKTLGAPYATQMEETEVTERTQLMNALKQHHQRWLGAYNLRKDAALEEIPQQAADVLSALLCATLTEKDSSSAEAFDAVTSALCGQVLHQMCHLVRPWLLHLKPERNLSIALVGDAYEVVEEETLGASTISQLEKEADFLNALLAILRAECEHYRTPDKESAVSAAEAICGEKRTAAAATPVSAESAAPAGPGGPERSTLASLVGKMSLSVSAQRARAEEWARTSLGMSFTTSRAKVAAKKAKKAPRKKSFAQQKADALRYAMAKFGWATVQDIPDNSDSEDESDGEEDGGDRDGSPSRAAGARVRAAASPRSTDAQRGEEDDGFVHVERAAAFRTPTKLPGEQKEGTSPKFPFQSAVCASPAHSPLPRPATPVLTESDTEETPEPISPGDPRRDTTAGEPVPDELLGFYQLAIADLYRQNADVSPEVVKECQDPTTSVNMQKALRKFERLLCSKLKLTNRHYSRRVTSADCTFQCEIDFNGIAGLNDRTSLSSSTRAASPLPSRDGYDPNSPALSESSATISSVGTERLSSPWTPPRCAVRNRHYTLQVKDPVLSKASCIYYHLFPRHRFLKAKLAPLSRNTMKGGLQARCRQLVEDGVCFGGRTYHFLAGEGKDLSEGQAYLFATHDEAGELSPITIQEVRQALADFDQVTSGGLKLALPGKINARLLLGFSPTYPALSLVDAQIRLIDDVTRDGGMVMTDGCGLICSSLLANLPFAIHSGVKYCDRVLTSSAEDDGGAGLCVKMPLPNTLQVRLSCRKGLFKGCLTVTSDTTLCPPGCVTLRRSMLKVTGAPHISETAPCTLFVNKTFEKAAAAPLSAFRNLSDEHVTLPTSSANPWGASFSIDLALLLCHLGLPAEAVVELARKEIAEVECISRSRSVALDHVHRLLRRGERKDASDAADDYLDAEDRVSEEEAEDVEDLSSAFSSLPSWAAAGDPGSFLTARHSLSAMAKSTAQRALHFLFAGHALDEPQLQKLLHMLQAVALTRLKRLKFRLPNSAYLVGTPDPYGVLAGDEVFVYLPLAEGEIRTCATVHGCEVLVTRHPMHHPGDIRKLKAVSHPLLCALVGDSSNPVIFFSTQGARSQADMMSGGDFDGDEYCVIYNQSIVQAVRTVEPYNAADFPPVPLSKPRTLNAISTVRDELGAELLGSVLHYANSSMVGLYSTQWLAFADRNPSSAEARLCDHFARHALDAAKTGFDCSGAKLPPLLEKPDFLSDKLPNVKIVFKSVSVVGAVYDVIAQKIGYLKSALAAPAADKEVCTVVEDGKVVFCMHEEVQRRVSRKSEQPVERWELWQRWRTLYGEYRVGMGKLMSAGAGANEERSLTRRVKDYYIAAFDRDAEVLGQSDPRFAALSPYAARRVLAAIVYHITYENCLCSSNGAYPVGFCWEVCPAELHDNKRRSVAVRTRQHEHDLLPAGYLQDMYNISFEL